MLIKGANLDNRQIQQVKSAFINRWTVENQRNAESILRRYGFDAPTIAPIPDAQWIADHAFHFVKDGSRLMSNRHHAEPSYIAD